MTDDQADAIRVSLDRHLSEIERQARESWGKARTMTDPYALPKEADGRPENWSFGKLSQHQVAMAHAASSIRWTKHSIAKARAALEAMDYASAIDWTLQAQRSLSHAYVPVTGAQTGRMWRYISKRREAASVNAVKGNRQRRKYDEAQVSQWCSDWPALKAAGHSASSAAAVISKRYGLSATARQTIRKKLR